MSLTEVGTSHLTIEHLGTLGDLWYYYSIGLQVKGNPIPTKRYKIDANDIRSKHGEFR